MTGGQVCAVKNCKSMQNRTKMTKTSFFSFPKAVDRARRWAVLCSRNDLLDRVNILYKSYGVCAGHFEKRMFLTCLHNRLTPRAYPSIFPSEEVSTSTSFDHTYSVFNLPIVETKDHPLQEVNMNISRRESPSPPLLYPITTIDPLREQDTNCRGSLSPPLLFPMSAVDPLQEVIVDIPQRESPVVIPTSTVDSFRKPNVDIPQRESSLSPLLVPMSIVDFFRDPDVDVPERESSLSPLLVPMTTVDSRQDLDISTRDSSPLPSPSSSRTSSSMSVDTPTKGELWHTIKELQAEVAYLQKKLRIETKANCVDNITVEQYKAITRKFISSETLVNLICSQAKQPKS